MMAKKKNYSVILLRDHKGIYGIGSRPLNLGDEYSKQRQIILRPDILRSQDMRNRRSNQNVYQMIAGGFRHGMFSRCTEDLLRQDIHHDMLNHAGLSWPPESAPGTKQIQYWSNDKNQQNINRGKYHGYRIASLKIINSMISQALQEAASENVVKTARRFRFHNREGIYKAASISQRAHQLIETFPALALHIYCNARSYDPEDYDASGKRIYERKAEAQLLVERGAPLRHVAEVMEVPMAFRYIKPAAADFVVGSRWDPRLVAAHMPDSLPKMKTWLLAVDLASQTSPELASWTAKHCMDIAPTSIEVNSFLSDVADWVRACNPSRVREYICGEILFPDQQCLDDDKGAANFVTRHFSPDMSLRSVTKLSDAWHEAVACNMNGANYEFSDPWYPGGQVDGLEIVPITNSAELYREGSTMHHCVGTYAESILEGSIYVYSVRQGEKRIATLALDQYGGKPYFGEIRGPCNAIVPAEVSRAANKWFRSITRAKKSQ
jgi:hypothetical protein